MRDLICINATPWTISASDTHMQIGCINETHQWWLDASDEDVAVKGRTSVGRVVEYRFKYGSMIKSLITTMKEKSNDQKD